MTDWESEKHKFKVGQRVAINIKHRHGHFRGYQKEAHHQHYLIEATIVEISSVGQLALQRDREDSIFFLPWYKVGTEQEYLVG